MQHSKQMRAGTALNDMIISDVLDDDLIRQMLYVKRFVLYFKQCQGARITAELGLSLSGALFDGSLSQPVNSEPSSTRCPPAERH
jgi:hypothetical protein